jgi:signal peptidase I
MVTESLANLSIGVIVTVALALTAIRMALARSRQPTARWMAEMSESVVFAAVFVFMLIRPFCAQAFYIPSESMEPTLYGHEAGLSATGENYPSSVHDHLFVNKMVYRFREPSRGDIVVFRAPKAADFQGGFKTENTLIKRVVGIPGDVMQIKNGTLWRNGRPVPEPTCDSTGSNAPLYPRADEYGSVRSRVRCHRTVEAGAGRVFCDGR